MKMFSNNYLNRTGNNLLKSIACILTLLWAALPAQGQFVYQWAFKAGTNVGSAVDIGECIARTPAGNYVVSGIFRDVVDFDPSGAIVNRTSLGINDIYIAEYDGDGNYIRATSFGSPNNESIKAMALDAAGNIYVTGQFNTSCDFNLAGPPAVLTIPGGSTSTSNIYVAKYDALGNYVWAISIGGTDQEVVNDIALDEEGNIYITGDFYTTADFDPSGNTANLTSSGGTDIFFAKYDNNGNYLWAKRIGNITTSNLHDSGRGIGVDPDGNIILAGYISYGTVDMDPDPAHTAYVISPVYQNSFIAKYDPNGNYIWAKGMGSAHGDINQVLELDGAGNIYLAASFYTDASYKLVDYDPDPGNADYLPYFGQYDIVLAKYDNDGNYQWAKSFGSSSSDGPNDIEVDAQGNVYLAGYFILTVDFDPSPGNTVNLVSAGGSSTENGFIAKYTSSGEYVSAMSIASGGSSQVRAIALDSANNVFATGSFYQTADFDPDPDNTAIISHVNNSDIFVAKYATGGACPAPAASFTYNQLAGFLVQFTNTSGTGEDAGYLWDFGDGNTSSFENPSFTFLFEGTYPVTLTVTTTCGSHSRTVQVEVEKRLGIGELNPGFTAHVFPNPAVAGPVVVQASSVQPDEWELSLFDLSGRLVHREAFLAHGTWTRQLELPPLGKGVYSLLIRNSRGGVCKKLVIV